MRKRPATEPSAPAYRLLEQANLTERSALPANHALLLLSGSVLLDFAEDRIPLSGGQAYLHAGYAGGEPGDPDASEELSLPITLEHCRGLLLPLPERLLPELPAGEVLQLEPALTAVLQSAFFQPGRDERIRQAATGYLLELLRYARPAPGEAFAESVAPFTADSSSNDGSAAAPGGGAPSSPLSRAAISETPGAVPPARIIPADPLAGRVCRLLQEEPERNWSLELLEERCGADRRKIAAACRKCGLPGPLRYLNEVRIVLACRLLSENEQTVSHIAAQTGYADVAGFSHFFRRHTGKSPRQYRQDTAWLV